jgi:hypothetical protein
MNEQFIHEVSMEGLLKMLKKKRGKIHPSGGPPGIFLP